MLVLAPFKLPAWYARVRFGVTTLYSSADADGDLIDDYTDVMLAARRYIRSQPEYVSDYFAGGYPPEGQGVCADVIWRALKEAGYDLKAMLDEDVEQAAKEAAAVALADEDPRVALIRRYADANEIVDANVTGALNTNFAYFMGLMDGGATGGDLTESDVLADVQAQEPRIRADTTEWVYSFLLMAYAPASDEDIEALIAFSETDAGEALNVALFDAFDVVFRDISRELGLASARFMTTQDL